MDRVGALTAPPQITCERECVLPQISTAFLQSHHHSHERSVWGAAVTDCENLFVPIPPSFTPKPAVFSFRLRCWMQPWRLCWATEGIYWWIIQRVKHFLCDSHFLLSSHEGTDFNYCLRHWVNIKLPLTDVRMMRVTHLLTSRYDSVCVVLTRRVGTGGCLTGWLFSVKRGQVTGWRPHAHGALLLWLGGPAALWWGNGTPETGWRANAAPGTCNKTEMSLEIHICGTYSTHKITAIFTNRQNSRFKKK